MALLNLRYAVVDLASGEVEERDLPEGILSIDMFDQVDSILREHGNAFAIGSGLATGSFVPAACGGFLRVLGDAPSLERTCFLTGGIGPELKFTGFDLLIIKNAAAEPGYVWVRDGIAEFVPSPTLTAKDSWERTDTIRADQGDRKIQVLTVGPWGEAGSAHSQLVANYWSGEDRRGFAAEFGRRNLLALAMRGMGEVELEDPEGHFETSNEIRARHLSTLGTSGGLASFCEVAGGQGFADLRHRDVACFGCPYPCRTFYKVAEDPKTMALESKEPGYLTYDTVAVEGMAARGMPARDTVSIMMACARVGVDPLHVVDSVMAAGNDVTTDTIRPVLSGQVISEAAGPRPAGLFDGLLDEPSMSLCLQLGLCPRYWSRVGLDVSAISVAVEKASGVSLDL
ncbi:TPA: hypothetical protein HA259_03035 [Thermoplasmata archaeon]|nr:hypothetical protein [Thermoplasmata archaeon]